MSDLLKRFSIDACDSTDDEGSLHGLDRVKAYGVRCARLALESLPCRRIDSIDHTCLTLNYDEPCDRCKRLASLNPSGEG